MNNSGILSRENIRLLMIILVAIIFGGMAEGFASHVIRENFLDTVEAKEGGLVPAKVEGEEKGGVVGGKPASVVEEEDIQKPETTISKDIVPPTDATRKQVDIPPPDPTKEREAKQHVERIKKSLDDAKTQLTTLRAARDKANQDYERGVTNIHERAQEAVDRLNKDSNLNPEKVLRLQKLETELKNDKEEPPLPEATVPAAKEEFTDYAPYQSHAY